MSVNYTYVIDAVKGLGAARKGAEPVCLDFGCGAGHIVEKGLKEGLDFYGADPYPEGRSEHYEKEAEDKDLLRDRIFKIENDKLPFPDNHFDVVVSNVVFEHIKEPEKALDEIYRVLKPGGAFLCLFPTADVWWEGHVKLYFAHWFKPRSKLLHFYLKTMRTLGVGQDAKGMSPSEWASHYQKYLEEYCFYRPVRDVNELWNKVFHATPESREYSYMKFRLEHHPRLKKFTFLADFALTRPLLVQIYRMRAGRIFLVRKQAVSSAS